jgi:hypothetical protein
MKQLLPLFLFLLPCLALAQYPSNGNQKITLGEQTTADGLIYRGVLADTGIITPLSDTSAYIILDTVNHRFYNYNRATNVWSVAGGGTAVTSITGGTGLTGGTITTSGTLAADTNFLVTRFDTASMLTNYWRSGRFNGTLPILNGGTGQTTLAAAGIVTTAGGTNNRFTAFTGSTTVGNTNLYRQVSGGDDFIGINVSDPTNYSYLVIGGSFGGQYALVKGTKMFGYFASEASAGNGSSDTSLAVGNFVRGADISFFTRPPISGGVTTKLKILNNGNVGIGTASPAVQFHTTSNVRFAGLVNYDPVETDADGDIIDGGASDINLKNTIEPINYGLNSINQLKPVSYLWNDVNRKLDSTIPDIGFIAQDVMDVIPEAVRSNGDGDLQLNYKAITATLVKAIQEQNLLIKALEQRIINLENK